MSARILSQVLATLVLLTSNSSVFAQNAPEMLRLFGGLMQGAIVEAAMAEWRKVRPAELACIELALQQRGTSASALARQGIAPADGRLAGIRAACAPALVPSQVVTTTPASPAPAPQALSAMPTYDCTKAKSGTGRILCMDPAGAKADWDLSAVYWAGMFALPEGDRDAFRCSHEEWVQSVNRTCRVLPDQAAYSPQQTRCVFGEFRKKTDAYQSGLRGDGLAESRLSPEQRAGIQSALGALGLFDGIVDGEFGPRTRTAIKLYQEQSGEAQSEFLTSAQRARLAQGVQSAEAQRGFQPVAGNDPNAGAVRLTPTEAAAQCQSEDVDKRLAGCTAIIDGRGKGSGVAVADAYDGRCRSYNDKGQYARAAEDCRAAIDLNARHSYAYNNLATALSGLGDLQGSIGAYTKSIELKPNFIYAYLGRADAFGRSGDKESAKKDLDRALEIDPGNQRAKGARTSLALETPVLKEARIFLGDVQKFISEQTSAPPAISEIAAAALNLQTALAAFDDRAAAGARARLDELLTSMQGFADFRAQQEAERSRELTRQFARAAERAEQQAYFVAEFLRRNLGYRKTEALLGLKDRLAGPLKPQSIDEHAIAELNNAVAALESFVGDNSLSEDYKRIVEARAATAATRAASSTPAIDQLQNGKNAVALAGAAGDLVLLFNASRSAPSIAKQLSGEFVFLTGTASLCFAQPAMDEDRVRFLERLLKDQGARDVRIVRSPCNMSSLLTSMDIVAFQRGELRKQPPEYVVGLLDLLKNDGLREYRTVTEGAYDAEVQNIRAVSLRIAGDVENDDTLSGFGVLAVTEDAVPVCVVAAEGVEEQGLRDLLQKRKDQISHRLRSEWTMVGATLDGAFVSLAREKCGYVAADAAGLRSLSRALRRDGRTYEFAPLWLSIAEVTAAGTQAVRAEREKAERRIAAEHTGEALQARKEAATETLRDQNGVRAHGLRDRLQKMIKDAADKPLSAEPRRAVETEREFPSFSVWLDGRFDEQWETTSVTPEIADFGTVQWNRRTLEGIIVRMRIEQKNAARGVRQTGCFTFGLVNDDEFSVERDLFDVACARDGDVIAGWKARRQFRSLWNAE